MHFLVLFFLIFSCNWFTTDLVLAGQVDEKIQWSFVDHPQPARSDLTAIEQDAFFAASEAAFPEDDLCDHWFGVEYQIYLDRFPAFNEVWNKRERMRRWREHIAQNNAVQRHTCVYAALANELIAIASTDEIGEDFDFCARFNRMPRNKNEEQVKQRLNELLVYANFGRQRAYDSLVTVMTKVDFIWMPSQISYYFAVLINELHPDETSADSVEIFKEGIEPKRIAFIHNAVKRRDFHTVAETHPPCSAR